MAPSESSLRNGDHGPAPTSSSLRDFLANGDEAQNTLIAGLFYALLERCRAALHSSRLLPPCSSEAPPRDPPDEQQAVSNRDAVKVDILHLQNVERNDVNNPSTAAEQIAAGEKARALLADILSRLGLWASSIDKAEAAITHAPSLYRNVVELLVECCSDVKRLLVVWNDSGDNANPTNEATALRLDLWLEKANYVLDDEETVQAKGVSKDLDETSSASSTYRHCDAEELLDLLDENVDLLMDLLPSIEHFPPIQAQTSYTIGSTIKIEVSTPAHAWVSQVLDKYPSAPLALSERLGEANWQRFCRLRSSYDEGAARDLEQARTVFHDSGIGASLGKPTGRASSVASHSSFASSTAADSNHFNSVPPEPQEVALGETFTCSICQSTVFDVRNTIEWKREFTTHVGRHMEEIALSTLPRELHNEDPSADLAAHAAPEISGTVRHTQFYSPAEWEKIKPTFARYYLAHRMRLDEVMAKLSREHNFHASKKAYVTHIGTWGFYKNLEKSKGRYVTNFTIASRDYGPEDYRTVEALSELLQFCERSKIKDTEFYSTTQEPELQPDSPNFLSARGSNPFSLLDNDNLPGRPKGFFPTDSTNQMSDDLAGFSSIYNMSGRPSRRGIDDTDLSSSNNPAAVDDLQSIDKLDARQIGFTSAAGLSWPDNVGSLPLTQSRKSEALHSVDDASTTDTVVPNSSTSNAGKRRKSVRVVKACDMCRRLKIVCDEGYPRCAGCLRLNRECTTTVRQEAGMPTTPPPDITSEDPRASLST
ncbi:18S rRNA maturation protein [Exophiala xenobiotica]|uniref:18S rRNA maturation protein n=1 Tax=Lithohypha guttulata TaxID=1690604 RepID=A0ABR0KDD0_9EURO|nr:18S rRNA maturation protein [Lithohypha guttulata]KAK5316961.1 18S rRNA maturation protein [Exophiala xenobiotica]